MDIRSTYLRFLVKDVEHNLERFDQATGRFMTGDGWAVTNQDIVYPLALLYTTPAPDNPYYGDERILQYALRGADAWRDFQYPDGRVEFVKVDGSRWGPTYMPWSMYHWLETYALLRDRLDPTRRARWEEGLSLAYTGIADELENPHVHNIPTWKGMALYRAGQIFDRPDWRERGRCMVRMAAEEQTSAGYWREHHGPTTLYNLVYVHAIGLYHIFSGDESVLPCLKRATEFHIHYTYPDGRVVETIDGRVKYHDHVSDLAHASFALFPEGRRYVRLLVENMLRDRHQKPGPTISYVIRSGSIRIANARYGLSPRLASAYVHYCDGPEAPIPQDNDKYVIYDRGLALTRRRDGWFYCLSETVTPPVETRWGQDRQNFVSVWNERSGLIIGGGNSKDQPIWSTFTVGKEPTYLPGAAALQPGDDADVLSLTYGNHTCTLTMHIVGRERLEIAMSGPADNAARGRLLLRLSPNNSLRTASGTELPTDMSGWSVDDRQTGGWVIHRGWRISMPHNSTLTWPVYPFNPYAADGAAPIEEAVAILSIPLGASPTVTTIEITS